MIIPTRIICITSLPRTLLESLILVAVQHLRFRMDCMGNRGVGTGRRTEADDERQNRVSLMEIETQREKRRCAFPVPGRKISGFGTSRKPGGQMSAPAANFAWTGRCAGGRRREACGLEGGAGGYANIQAARPSQKVAQNATAPYLITRPTGSDGRTASSPSSMIDMRTPFERSNQSAHTSGEPFEKAESTRTNQTDWMKHPVRLSSAIGAAAFRPRIRKASMR